MKTYHTIMETYHTIMETYYTRHWKHIVQLQLKGMVVLVVQEQEKKEFVEFGKAHYLYQSAHPIFRPFCQHVKINMEK
jgi:hypothetical protein